MSVTIIIATTCELHRAPMLRRAIDSVTAQEGPRPELLIVVNGTRFDPDVRRSLEARDDLTVHYSEWASLPAAIRFGRSLVATQFFGFLDDDDEYLPQAIRTRLEPLLADPRIDFVATNGYDHVGGTDQLRVTRDLDVNGDPLVALMRENWLASAGGLYRSATIETDLFDPEVRYLEWTYLAFRLSLSRQMTFLDAPTYRIHDSPTSLSKSEAYEEAQVAVLRRMLDFEVPSMVRRLLRRKLGRALHSRSTRKLELGELAEAWHAHWESLKLPGGIDYLPYTRKFLFRRLRAA